MPNSGSLLCCSYQWPTCKEKVTTEINVTEILPAMKRHHLISAADKLSLNKRVKMC